jgi:hypothetical protein
MRVLIDATLSAIPLVLRIWLRSGYCEQLPRFCRGGGTNPRTEKFACDSGASMPKIA